MYELSLIQDTCRSDCCTEPTELGNLYVYCTMIYEANTRLNPAMLVDVVQVGTCGQWPLLTMLCILYADPTRVSLSERWMVQILKSLRSDCPRKVTGNGIPLTSGTGTVAAVFGNYEIQPLLCNPFTTSRHFMSRRQTVPVSAIRYKHEHTFCAETMMKARMAIEVVLAPKDVVNFLCA